MLTAIAAISENNVLGKNNKLLWHLPDDFKRFRKLTMGHHIIMGRKTFESLPCLLPKRTHLVISRQNLNFEGTIVLKSLDEALKVARYDEQPFIIGGGETYRLAMPLLKKIELTRVHHIFEGDTFFPEMDREQWRLVAKEHHGKDMSHKFDITYETYLRVE